MVALTDADVFARTEVRSLEQVRTLNLWGSNLSDVSILARLPNVEVLSLSVNNISTLEPFAACHKLVELYLRRNDIADLRELRFLQQCPDLRSLWLVDNPCCAGLGSTEYRLRVLRALPRLETLDSVAVTPAERHMSQASDDAEFERFVSQQSVDKAHASEAANNSHVTPGRRGAPRTPAPRAAPPTLWEVPLQGEAPGPSHPRRPPESPSVNALYAVLALLPVLSHEELVVVEKDLRSRLNAMPPAGA